MQTPNAVCFVYTIFICLSILIDNKKINRNKISKAKSIGISPNMNSLSTINWNKVKVIIFDVDGTLYSQAKLRKRMLLSLLSYYAIRPWRVKELMILRHFRAEREKRTGNPCINLEEAQYQWCADKGNFKIAQVKKVVDYWMFNYPNQYLADSMYPGTRAFFDSLQHHGKKIAIYSDYKADAKMKAMGLHADLIVASTDPEIDRLKPDPTALHFIMEKFSVLPEECLFIGDRQELDGVCASNAQIPYLIVEKEPVEKFKFYTNLTEKINNSLNLRTYESNTYAS